MLQAAPYENRQYSICQHLEGVPRGRSWEGAYADQNVTSDTHSSSLYVCSRAKADLRCECLP
jgi:hypothetical protein